ncbi:helix-turn-helix domain-containing protein [Streptomyces atroolivaceus]|uniref:helix-turn-helix domain-containing protein n=1 Tax=Streptomyces atroolivaceus TaxID=66869 RepID=UPI0033E0263D
MNVAVAGAVEDSADPGGGFLRCFGRQVKLLREAAGLTQAELGSSVGYGEAHIASVEQGRRIPKPEMVDAVDRVVGGRGVLVAMKGEVERARYPSFFRQYTREVQDESALHSEPKKVGAFESTHGVLRAQALTPRESLAFIERLLGER